MIVFVPAGTLEIWRLSSSKDFKVSPAGEKTLGLYKKFEDIQSIHFINQANHIMGGTEKIA